MTSSQTEQIQLVVFDIDDTLLPRSQTHLSEAVKHTIHRLHKSKIITVPATGRGIYNTPEEIIQILDSPYFITINGHIILNHKQQILAEYPMGDELTQKLKAVCIENNISLIFKYANCYHTVHEGQLFNKPNHMKYLNSPVGKPLGCFLIPPPSFPMLLLIEAFPELSFTKGGTGYDVYGKEADKSTGIETVLQKLNLTWENVMCFGDAENDITMIQKAGLGIAMGNACEALKKEADRICPSSIDDGITFLLTNILKL